MNRIADMQAMGIDPRMFSDKELLKKVRYLGVKSLAIVRQLTGGEGKRCPHCGLIIEVSSNDTSHRQGRSLATKEPIA